MPCPAPNQVSPRAAVLLGAAQRAERVPGIEVQDETALQSLEGSTAVAEAVQAAGKAAAGEAAAHVVWEESWAAVGAGQVAGEAVEGRGVARVVDEARKRRRSAGTALAAMRCCSDPPTTPAGARTKRAFRRLDMGAGRGAGAMAAAVMVGAE